MAVWDALASAAGGIISSIGGLATRNSDRKFQQRLVNQQNEFNAQEAEKSYQRQVEMFNMTNEYNSPANQRKLYEEGGFNPNLAMSGAAGTVASSGSSAAPQASSGSAPQTQSQNPLAVFGDIAGIMSSLSQSKVNDAETAKIMEEAKMIKEQTAGQKLLNDNQEVYNGIFKDLGRISYEIDMNKADAERAYFDQMRHTSRMEERLKEFDLSNIKPMQVADYGAKIQVEQSQDFLNRMLAAKTKQEKELLVKEFALKCAIGYSTIAAEYARAKSESSQAGYYESLAKNTDLMSGLYKPGGLMSRFYNKQIDLSESQRNLNYWTGLSAEAKGSFDNYSYSTLGGYYIDAVKQELILRAKKAQVNSTDTYMILDGLKEYVYPLIPFVAPMQYQNVPATMPAMPRVGFRP